MAIEIIFCVVVLFFAGAIKSKANGIQKELDLQRASLEITRQKLALIKTKLNQADFRKNVIQINKKTSTGKNQKTC
jgi:hypothetical protein